MSERSMPVEVPFDGASYVRVMQRLFSQGEPAVVLFVGEATDEKQQALGQLIEMSSFNLHQVDLRTRIGERTEETHGNLRELFDVGAEGEAVLYLNHVGHFVDQVSGEQPEDGMLVPGDYLIQRIDAYQGIVILSLDRPVHTRRLREELSIDAVITF